MSVLAMSIPAVTATFPADMRLCESLGQSRAAVWVVWMLDDETIHPKWKRWCAVHASQESADEYLAAVRALDPESVYGADQEWLIDE